MGLINYYQYTSTSTGNLMVGYICSCCGRKQIFLQKVKGVGSANDQGVWTQKGKTKRQMAAAEEAKRDLVNKINKIRNDMYQRKYRSLDAKYRCNCCGHQEPWSEIHNSKVGIVMGLFIMIEIILVLIYLHSLSMEGLVSPWILLPVALAVVVLIVVDEAGCRKKEKMISCLPVQCLPVLIENQEMYQYYSF